MAKSDLLLWVKKHSPPLLPHTININTANPVFQNDYDRFNAVTTAAEALVTLKTRKPPLSLEDINENMVEYNK